MTNEARGDRATVVGGQDNLAIAPNSFIGGGIGNNAGVARFDASTATHATIGGGASNEVLGANGVIAGGSGNTAGFPIPGSTNPTPYAAVVGGMNNNAGGDGASIGGGVSNTTSANHAAIGGGESNQVSGTAATVPGGSENEAAGDYSLAAGRMARATNTGSFVWNDSRGTPVTSDRDNQFKVRVGGGARIVKDDEADNVAAALRVDNETTNTTEALHVVTSASGFAAKVIATNPDGMGGVSVLTDGTAAIGLKASASSTTGTTTGVQGFSASTAASAAGVRAIGNTTSEPGVPRAAALNITDGAITVSGTSPAGTFDVDLLCAFVETSFGRPPCTECSPHVHDWACRREVRHDNPYLRSDSIVLLTAECKTIDGVLDDPCGVSLDHKHDGHMIVVVWSTDTPLGTAVKIHYLIINPEEPAVPADTSAGRNSPKTADGRSSSGQRKSDLETRTALQFAGENQNDR